MSVCAVISTTNAFKDVAMKNNVARFSQKTGNLAIHVRALLNI